jgi:tetratricopeptide (TPR) repeat protein
MVAGRLDEALRTVREARELHARVGDIDRVHALAHTEADIHRETQAPADAIAVLDELLADDRLEVGRRVHVLTDRAVLRESLGDPSRGADDADEAARLLLTWDADGQVVATALSLGAQFAERAGQNERAVASYRVAVQRLEAAGESTVALRYGLGRALLATGAAHEAVEVIDEVLQDETAAGEAPGSRAITVGLLARAFEHAEEWGNALRAWEITADLHEEADEPARRASALVAWAQLLGRLGETDESVDTLTTAVEVARTDPENRGMLADALHSLAQVKAYRGDDDALTPLDEAIEIGRADDAPWLVADLLDTRARFLANAGRVDEAVACALQAADGFLSVGGVPQAGGSEFVAARILLGAERTEEAVAVLRSALEHAADEEQLRQAVAIDLGDALEGLGRHGEAAEVRSTLPA